MDWNRIIGQLIEGYGTKALAVLFALIVAHTVYEKLTALLAPVSQGLGS